MKLHFILIALSLVIFGGGIAAGIMWNMDNQNAGFDPFKSASGAVTLPVPEEITNAFAKEFRAVHSANAAQSVSPEVSFSGKGGEIFRMSDFTQNGYLLLNLWATWCGPCVIELPHLESLRNRYAGRGLEVLAVSIDHARNLEEIETFLQTRGIDKFALYLDESRALRHVLPARGIPTTYLISPQNEILYIFEGDAKWDGPQGRAFFDALLAKKQ